MKNEPIFVAGGPVLSASSPEKPLSSEEITELRDLLGLLGPHWVQRLKGVDQGLLSASQDTAKLNSTHAPSATSRSGVHPAVQVSVAVAPAAPPVVVEKKHTLKEDLLEAWAKSPLKPSDIETQHGTALRAILEKIPEETNLLQIYCAICSVFPLQGIIRHASADHRHSIILATADRFLGLLAGIAFDGRRDLLRCVTRYLNDLSDQYAFHHHEGEPFNNEHYERIDGANRDGRTIKEVRAFMVARKNGNQIARLGKAWT